MEMIRKRKRMYAWEFPIRFTHWINFLCILLLSVTGYYIGNPFMHAVSSKEYMMGWIRFIHFVAAYVFLMSIIIRLYWSLAGNKYANILNWLPITPRRIVNMVNDIKCELLISDKTKCNVGHSALGGLTYLLMMLLFIFMIISGFGMYSVNHSGQLWIYLGGWLLDHMHLQIIRQYHHLAMYVILAFAAVHIYIAWFRDSKEKSALMGSIFTGYKFIPKEDLE